MASTIRDLTPADYETIGRELVAHALTKGKEKHPSPARGEKVHATTVRVGFTFPADDGGVHSDIWSEGPCCVCVWDIDMVICRGWCCD